MPNTFLLRTPPVILIVVVASALGMLPPRTEPVAATGDVLDRADRRQAVALYYNTYVPSLAVLNDWNGNTATCNAGTVGAAYAAASLQTLQYFRMMANVPELTTSASDTADAQQLALMMSANNAVSRNPPSSWQCYSTAGAAAAAQSNMTLGAAGPAAIVQQMTGADDATLPDRTRMLDPRSATVGIGSTSNANALWLSRDVGSRGHTTEAFTFPLSVSWPAAGVYTPYQVVFPRWSVALDRVTNDDTVFLSMSRIVGMARVPVPINVLPLVRTDNANIVIWEPQGLSFGPGMQDQTFYISFSGYQTAGYFVTIIDPARVATEGSFWVGLDGPAGGGYVEKISGDIEQGYHANEWWTRVWWPAYNDSVGTTRPASCDLFGDNAPELVIGLGSYPAFGGFLEIKTDAASMHDHLAWLRVPWPDYNAANGETFPACGDLDGDGRDEIVVGLGPGGGGYVALFDDAVAGFAPMGSGWLNPGWTDYNEANGAMHPAVGQLDGDAREELVLGVGAGLLPGTGGMPYVCLLDDSVAGFQPLFGSDCWFDLRRPLGTPNPNTSYGNGETWPSIGDLDGRDGGWEELVVGLGPGAEGWFRTLRTGGFTGIAPASGFQGGWLKVPWPDYAQAVGATYPAIADLNGDFRSEIILGLKGPAAMGFLDVWHNVPPEWQGTWFYHRSWPRVHWSLYNGSGGGTTPGGR